MTLFRARYSIIDFFRKTQTLPLYDQILSSQWLPQREIKNIQIQNLNDLLFHCAQNVPYYINLFKKHFFYNKKINKISEISCLPVLNKDTIRKNFDNLKANNFNNFKPKKGQTGGTTGEPLPVYRDKKHHSYQWANNLRSWNAGNYNLGDQFIHIASGSLLPNTTNIITKIYNYLQNAILITSYHLNDDKLRHIIERIKISKASFIYGYSSSIYLLAQFCRANNIKLDGRIKAIFTTSDMLYKWQRSCIENVFNANVFDIYGCPEGGIISFECPNHDGYHYNQESVVVEITNKDSNGFGKIISTPLFNYAFPFIRYDTGDVGMLSNEKCSCGRNLIKIKKVGGRIRDFIVLQDGRYIHGAFFNHLQPLYDTSWIKNYQIIQEKIDLLRIKFTCIDNPNQKDLTKITHAIKKGLLPSLEIVYDFNGIEYSGGGKFRLIISNVKNKWDDQYFPN